MFLFRRHTSHHRRPKRAEHGHQKHAIVKCDGMFILRGLNTGRVLGRHKTYIEALNQLRAVERSMHTR